MNSKRAVVDRLCELIAREFPRMAAPITRVTKAAEITGWDSLGHNRLIISIESEFKVQLPLVDALNSDSVAALAKLVVTALGGEDE